MINLSCIRTRDILFFVFLKYLKQLVLLILLAILVFLAASAHAAPQFLACDGGVCDISVFRSDCPVISTSNSLEVLIPTDGQGLPAAIAADNIVTFVLNGTASDIVCDNTPQELPPNPADPGLENIITCFVERGEGSPEDQAIIFSVSISDQDTFTNSYQIEPARSGYGELAGTGENDPFCVTADKATACKWQQQNINDDTLSQMGVKLGEWVVFTRTTVTDIILGYTAPAVGEQFDQPESICVFDRNDNGTIENDEYGACQGQLCLLDAAECLASTSEALCPEGGILNPDTDLCEAPAAASCASPGFVYDVAADICRAPADCPDVGILTPGTDQCELLVADECPSGYSYNATLNKCTKNPTCSGGGSFDPGQNRCENSVVKTCPSGYTLNTSINKCERAPTCPSGSTYNTSINKCTKTAVASCPSGYTDFNGTCRKTPTCPAGGSYSSTNKRCEAATAYKCSLDNASYPSSSTCNANCLNTGTCGANIHTDMCWGSTGFTGIDLGCSFADGSPMIGTGTMLQTYSQCPGNNPPPGGSTTNYDGICLHRHPVFNIAQPAFFLYNVSTSTFTCSLTGTSYSTLGSCQNACSQSQSCISQCPSGYSQSGSLCIANPVCSGGGSFNAASGKCEIQTSYSCSSGFTYDLALGKCVASPTCTSGGSLNTASDTCQLAVTESCSSGYSQAGSICIRTPTCSGGGFYNATLDKCTVAAAGLCPSGYTFNAASDICARTPVCPAGTSYSPTVDECVEPAIHDCPETYSYSLLSGLCEAMPICEGGAYRPDTDDCLAGDMACPYGPEYPCLEYNGTAMCSPHECTAYQDSVTDADTVVGANDAPEDGEIDENGSCLGTVYVFNGNDQRCRTDGVTIAFDDCCKSEDYLFGLLQCSENEKQLARMRDEGLCHYIGEYCSKEVDLLLFSFCIEHSKTFCCFNSKLGRIVHEEGRAQMSSFDTWGVPESPRCRGFKADEFQMVDFSRVDLAEWYGDIRTKSQDSVRTNVQQTIENYYDNL